MIYGFEGTMDVRTTQESPCAGTYTILVPTDRDATPVRTLRVAGAALRAGTYLVRIERADDGVS